MIKGIDLTGFFPEYIKIESTENLADQVIIRMKTQTKSAKCPVCGQESEKQHSFHAPRLVCDLPILGKSVLLEISTMMYYCTNQECDVVMFTEYLKDFIGIRSKWTERCESFIMSVALNTSCEAASMICKKSGISISGDTIIRMLLRNTSEMPYTGKSIGVDDWAYRKGQSYGTLICDVQTGKPIALFPGRDGSALKNWLKNNKQVTLVTRDRASAYASAIQEILPDAVQVADRFHLFQNFLEATKEALKTVVPNYIQVYTSPPETTIEPDKNEPDKKK
jgi:transposase